MEQFKLSSIGTIQIDDDGMKVVLDKEYIPAITNLADFKYINVLWWFDKYDNTESRRKTC
jgi:tRNA (Thr-GGU) A37 N-methylase